MGSTPLRVPLFAGLALALMAGPAFALDADQFAERLATLRGEVEALATDLDLRKEELRGRLRALDAQKADLQVRVRQEELRLEQLEQALETEREAREADAVASEALKPSVRTSIATVRASVQGSLPFRKGERLAELDALEAELEDGTKTPREVASRLWGFCEDELRLSRENALDRQVITLDGAETLVDVARLGMVALYFRTDDGRFGRAVSEGEDVRWVYYTDPESQARLDELFDALAKQIRVGYFELPAAFPAPVEVSR
ncbi:MAG: DUF3450 family protein [Alphaproteobacteria bacterium]|nr:DUF3450 family protein [Alphaproteobacteria bacterium]MCB9796927.1 DUF3450 family protein [Alphaproteobacteria bacterium]